MPAWGDVYHSLPWREIYGAAALVVAAHAWWIDRKEGRLAAILILTSWLVTTTVLRSPHPSDRFAVYFIYDVSAYIALMKYSIRHLRPWACTFTALLAAQMVVSCVFWVFEITIWRYHEVINPLYICQMICAWAACRNPRFRRFSPMPPPITKEDLEAHIRSTMPPPTDPRYVW